ncbi:hypothetical protein YC2023_077753 [Brassica napus]
MLTHELKKKGEAAVKGLLSRSPSQARDLNQALGGRQPTGTCKYNLFSLRSKSKKKIRDTSKILGCRNGTTYPLKRAVVPGDHLTIEHPEFSWSACSTQGRCEVSLGEVTIAVAQDTHVDLEHPDISHLILQKFSADKICAKMSERKGSTQPPTRYCSRNYGRKENKQIKGATAP